MSRWFRLDDDVINDPKILLLPEQMRWIWVAFLCIASKNDGRIPDIKIVALSLRVKPVKAAEYLTVLTNAGLIDRDETGFAPHNWSKRQFKSDVSTDRVKRFREQDRNVSETAPQTQTETQAEKEHCPVDKSTRTKKSYSEEFEEKFWLPYPRSPTMSKGEAWKAWMKLDPDRRLQACQAIEPYRRYLQTKPNLETVHACRFLSQERFDGFLNGAAPIAASHAGSFV